MSRFRPRISPAMAVALLALFVALGGGSYAAIQARIGSAQIIDNSILSRDVHDGTLQSADVRDGTLGSADVSDGTLEGADVRDGTLTASDLAPGLLADGFSAHKGSFRLTAPPASPVSVTHLDLPAGNYVIFAKLWSSFPISGYADSVECRLVAGGDSDRTWVTQDALLAYSSIALNVIHQFTAPGNADLICRHVYTSNDSTLFDIKITAIRLATVSNVPGP
jgi:hypothetical protein